MQLPFRSFNSFLQEKFGCRVYKVSVDAGFSCPNRDGTKSLNGCIFCDETGSSSRTDAPSMREQILQNIGVRQSRYRAKKFIIHFQSFSNTYAPVGRLKALYDEAISTHPDIVGLSVSTRPDCVDEEKIKLLSSYKLPFVSVEYGMQTIHNKTLKLINRHETHEDFLKALDLTKKYGLHHCVHTILGLPGESKEEQMATADALKDLEIEGVKIHLLVAMENTPLADLYHKGHWKPYEFDEYISLLYDFLRRLPTGCIIHRLGGSGHPLHIVAPLWMKEMRNLILPNILNKFTIG